MSERPLNPGQGPGGILLTIGAVLLAVTCCAGPALLAGSGLVLLGGALADPAVLAIAVLVLSGAVLYTLRRHARARGRALGPSGAAGEAAGPVSGTTGVNDCCATSTPDFKQSGKNPAALR